jgi:hypothetical protein
MLLTGFCGKHRITEVKKMKTKKQKSVLALVVSFLIFSIAGNTFAFGINSAQNVISLTNTQIFERASQASMNTMKKDTIADGIKSLVSTNSLPRMICEAGKLSQGLVNSINDLMTQSNENSICSESDKFSKNKMNESDGLLYTNVQNIKFEFRKLIKSFNKIKDTSLVNNFNTSIIPRLKIFSIKRSKTRQSSAIVSKLGQNKDDTCASDESILNNFVFIKKAFRLDTLNAFFVFICLIFLIGFVTALGRGKLSRGVMHVIRGMHVMLGRLMILGDASCYKPIFSCINGMGSILNKKFSSYNFVGGYNVNF